MRGRQATALPLAARPSEVWVPPITLENRLSKTPRSQAQPSYLGRGPLQQLFKFSRNTSVLCSCSSGPSHRVQATFLTFELSHSQFVSLSFSQHQDQHKTRSIFCQIISRVHAPLLGLSDVLECAPYFISLYFLLFCWEQFNVTPSVQR